MSWIPSPALRHWLLEFPRTVLWATRLLRVIQTVHRAAIPRSLFPSSDRATWLATIPRLSLSLFLSRSFHLLSFLGNILCNSEPFAYEILIAKRNMTQKQFIKLSNNSLYSKFVWIVLPLIDPNGASCWDENLVWTQIHGHDWCYIALQLK